MQGDETQDEFDQKLQAVTEAFGSFLDQSSEVQDLIQYLDREDYLRTLVVEVDYETEDGTPSLIVGAGVDLDGDEDLTDDDDEERGFDA